MLAAASYSAFIVPGVTVEELAEAPLQHKSLVLVMFVNGSVGTLNEDV